jgi:hypothetical protein
MEFVCERCNYKSNLKGNIIKHLNNKTACPVINKNIERHVLLLAIKKPKDESVCLHCPWCDKLISRTNMGKHKKVCKKKPGTNASSSHTLPTMRSNEQMTQTPKMDATEENKKKGDEVVGDLLGNYIKEQVAKHVKSMIADMIEQETHVCISQLIKSNTIPDKNDVAENNVEATPSLAMKRYQKIKPSKRRLVWKTYIGMAHGEVPCLCCKSNNIDMLNFHCGHVVSDAEGGTTELSNLRPICSVCNSSMGSMNMKVFAKEQFDVEIA